MKNSIKKEIARQDADYAINPGNNNETSIKITDEICNLLIGERYLEDKEKLQVILVLTKTDFVISACNIISALPLMDKHGVFVYYSEERYKKLFLSIEDFFQNSETKEYPVELVYNKDRNSCLQGFDRKFNIRSYLVEKRSEIIFTKKDNGKIYLNIKYSNNDNQSFKSPSDIRHKSATIPYQTIYYGAPGTGKSYIIKQLTKNESVVRTTFHPDSDYSTFVGAYKPTTKTIELRDLSGHKVVEDGCVVKEEKIVYEFVEQAFLKAYIQAWKYLIDLGEVSDEPQKQFLIIEEINRGNCAQVFGDLFQLLDRNSAGFSEYPICADNDMQKQLQKAFAPLRGCSLDEIKQQFAELYDDSQMLDRVLNGEVILLPGNMFIWATMNTSDQSLFPIDSAFKRRWDWHYMPIAQGYDREGNPMQWTIDICGTEYDWWKFLNAINKHIGEVHSSEDKKLGFFFCKAEDGMIDAETFVGKVIFYLWNDVFKDFLYEGTLFRDKEGSLITFDRFYNVNPNGNITVNPDMVRIFLNNLGVESLQDSGEANMAETSAEQSDENSDEEVTA